MGKIGRNLGEGWKNSVIHLTTVSLKEDDNLVLEWRGAFINFSYRNKLKFGKLYISTLYIPVGCFNILHFYCRHSMRGSVFSPLSCYHLKIIFYKLMDLNIVICHYCFSPLFKIYGIIHVHSLKIKLYCSSL